jgi:dTDP-glucose pyrophosphorylase
MAATIAAEPWHKALMSLDGTIQQAIQCLDVSGMQIVLVTSERDTLYGTVTDGDIRRALLRGLTLECNVGEIANRNPLVAPPEMGREMVLQLMQANRIHQLPVVDRDRRVVGLHLWDEILTPSSRANPMIIMAGGRGTRLRPYTENCPKPMLEVGGKPMLEHIIEHAKAGGFINFVLAIHYLGNMIEDHFEDGRRWGVNIQYLREDTPLGTAGALSLLPKRPETPFIVTNGDVMTDVHYGEILEFHTRHQAAATMAVRQHEMQNPFGVVKTIGVEIDGFDEKPIYRSHINAGIYVLNPETLDVLQPGQHCDMPTLFTRVQRDKGGRAIVYPMHEPWLDVGRPDDLALARNKQF